MRGRGGCRRRVAHSTAATAPSTCRLCAGSERKGADASAALIRAKTFRRVEPNLAQERDEARIGMQCPKVARRADAMDCAGMLGHSALEPVNRLIVFA